MQPTNNLILVCAGADTAAAAQHSLPLLQLYLGVGRGGRVTPLSLPARLEGCYLGVSDLGLDGDIPGFCAEALLHEAKKQNMRGIFADIEADSPAARALLGPLDRLMHAVEHALLVAETAISGGSLDGYFEELQRQYPGRIAATLRPVSADFRLPAQDSEGHPLT